ncbi:GumC domain-containing protein [Pedobacter cryotolerans]|uniref:Lipopolysaccharide biosynthesis protein n=1 Tax=Pedobacter cryotolerans TaxID=2571270 RepID=A0A4U1CBN1_9SPHI|nr:lipopolysaccharide biosynthesis protein [Pedobacter cryotolerans]TKC03486.1 lipopolysaccharide biosynthesis protein [Pedobacter cryotolerans]
MTTESQQNINTQDEEISLKDLILKIREWWRYLLSKWMIILICAIVGGVLGFIYAHSKKAVYIATTTFVLEEEQSGGVGSLGGLASMAGLDLGGGGGGIFQGDNIFDLYKSRKMIEKTLFTKVESSSSQSLMEKYIEINNFRKSWAKNPELLNIDFKISESNSSNKSIDPKRSRLRDSIISKAVEDINKNYLTVQKPDKKLSKVQVDVKSRDEKFSKCFNDAIVKNVNDFYLQTKTKKSMQNVQIMQHKVDSVRTVMNGAIYSAAAVADATPNLNPTRQVQRVAPVQRAQFSAETNKAILGTLVQNLEMSKLALMKETPLLEIIDQPVYPLSSEKFTKVKGILIGSLLIGFFAIIFLLINKVFKNIMA